MKNWRKLLYLTQCGKGIFEYISLRKFPPGDFELLGGGVESYFTTKELSDYLKIPEQSIRRWVLNNEIPFHRIHNVIRYRLSEIEAWIGNNKDKLPSCAGSGSEGDLFNETEAGEAGGGAEGGLENETTETEGKA
jgi:excisionase family DNA binding protein